jgi:hypothetical protein
VARPKSPVVAARDHEIYSLWQRGTPLQLLAEQFNISPRRVGQIVAARHPEEGEDDDRSLYRGYLWRLFEEVRDLYREPGFKMSPTGRPAEDLDGNPAEDTGIKLQAAELELKVLESLRKLDARDKPQQQNLKVTHEVAEQQARASMEEITAKKLADDERHRQELDAARWAVVQGEVIRELPAGES